MKSFLVLSVVIAIAAAKPSGILAPHFHAAYSSPIHETIIAEAPAVVHHKSIVADIPTAVSHQQTSVVHHSPAVVHHEAVVEPAVRTAYVAHHAPAVVAHAAPAVFHQEFAPAVVHQKIAHAAPAVVHHEFAHAAPAVVHHDFAHIAKAVAPAVVHHEVAPAVVHHEVAHAAPAVLHHEYAHIAKSVAPAVVKHDYAHIAPAVVHHEFAHAAPAVVHHKSAVIAEAPVAVSEQHSTVVHKTAPIHHTVVAETPLVRHAVAPAVHHTVVSEPVGVKQTVSHQDASIVHSAAIHHEYPAVAKAVVADVHHVAPVSTQYHAQDVLGQYSFGYSSPLSSKAEVKTLDGVTKGEYNYLDAFGKEQSVKYESDSSHGFRVAATNLPVGPSPVVDTAEVAAAKAAHISIHEQTKAAIAAAKKAEIAHEVVHHEVAAVAPVVPSAYSYSYIAEKPIHHVSSAIVAEPAAFVHSLPVVGVAHDAVAVDAKIAPTGFVHQVGVVPGKAYYGAVRTSAHLKDEKPCD